MKPRKLGTALGVWAFFYAIVSKNTIGHLRAETPIGAILVAVSGIIIGLVLYKTVAGALKEG